MLPSGLQTSLWPVIEINGRDRPGLLHDVTAALTDAGLQIASAHISTYGVRVIDVFYVKDIFGLKVENEERLAALNESLLEAVSPGTAGETEKPAKKTKAAKSGKARAKSAKGKTRKTKQTKGEKSQTTGDIGAAE